MADAAPAPPPAADPAPAEAEAAEQQAPLAQFFTVVDLEDPYEKIGCSYTVSDVGRVVIIRVNPGGAFDRANIGVGSVLLSINNVPVYDDDSIIHAVTTIRQQGLYQFVVEIAIPKVDASFTLNLDELRQPLGFSFERHVDGLMYITQLTKDSPADKAGLKAHMLVRKIDDTNIYEARDIANAREAAIAKGQLTLDVHVTQVPVLLDANTRIDEAVVEEAKDPDAPAASPYRYRHDDVDTIRMVKGRSVRDVVHYDDPAAPTHQPAHTVGDVPSDYLGGYGPIEYPPPPFPAGGGVGGPSPAVPVPTLRRTYTSNPSRTVGEYYQPVGQRPYRRTGGYTVHPFSRNTPDAKTKYPVAQHLQNMYPHRRVDANYYTKATQPTFVEVPLYAGMRRDQPNTPMRGRNKIHAHDLVQAQGLGVQGSGSPVGYTPGQQQEAFSPARATSLYL